MRPAGRVMESTGVLREMAGVTEFDEEVFGMTVERVSMVNLVHYRRVYTEVGHFNWRGFVKI